MKTELLIDDNGLSYSSDDLSKLPVTAQIKTAEDWIKIHAYPRKRINHKISSYRMKHWAEQWGASMRAHLNTTNFEPYITNGAFIQAAINSGYEPIPTDFKSPNAYFRMGLRCPQNQWVQKCNR